MLYDKSKAKEVLLGLMPATETTMAKERCFRCDDVLPSHRPQCLYAKGRGCTSIEFIGGMLVPVTTPTTN